MRWRLTSLVWTATLRWCLGRASFSSFTGFASTTATSAPPSSPGRCSSVGSLGLASSTSLLLERFVIVKVRIHVTILEHFNVVHLRLIVEPFLRRMILSIMAIPTIRIWLDNRRYVSATRQPTGITSARTRPTSRSAALTSRTTSDRRRCTQRSLQSWRVHRIRLDSGLMNSSERSMLMHQILSSRLSPTSSGIRIDLSITQTGHPLSALHEQSTVVLGHSGLWIEKRHPETAFDAQSRVVGFAVLEQLFVGGIVEEGLDLLEVGQTGHLDGGVGLSARGRHCGHCCVCCALRWELMCDGTGTGSACTLNEPGQYLKICFLASSNSNLLFCLRFLKCKKK